MEFRTTLFGSSKCTLNLLFLGVFIWFLTHAEATTSTTRKEEKESVFYKSRSLLLDEVSHNNSNLFHCIPSGIHAFPNDFFTQEQRIKGGVLVHVFLAFYACAALGIVCHDYFVPSLDIITERMKLPPDIAGATFMAIGTSAPELFSSITGSFITEGDIGVGTIIGSAVFNIVGVTGLVGVVLWNEVLPIEWYPIARDCAVYGITILTLIGIIEDNIVTWWESLILLLIFGLYIIIICYNKRIEEWSLRMANRTNCCQCANSEQDPLVGGGKVLAPEIAESYSDSQQRHDSFSVSITASKEKAILQRHREVSIIEEIIHSGDEMLSRGSLCSWPSSGIGQQFWWVLMYPVRLLFFLTIPDSSHPRCARLFPVTFLMSVIWIGMLSYLAVWMVTVTGYTLSIPDSVSGLTILAAGTSVPEIISSIIVAKNGFGNMAISNLVGSNTFDISFCLGAPWLLKTALSKEGSLIVFSSALTYTTATLLLTLSLFVLVFVFSRWKLNRKVGLTYIAIYALFVAVACMYEMNVFGDINVKSCE